MPIISLIHFPSPNWDFWKGKKNNNNKQKKILHILSRKAKFKCLAIVA